MLPNGSSPRRARTAVPAVAILVLAVVLPASAFGQATRTWVSGVGDDANPCSRTAPCKTFAGAISKTAVDGEINALDSGGFGAVTITKSITLSSVGVTAGLLAAGTTGILINAPTNAKVTIRNMDIGGAGTGLNGIRVLQAGVVRVEDSKIYNFTLNGILAEPAANQVKLVVDNTVINDNGQDGILAAPTASGGVVGTVRDSQIDDNTCGVVATSAGQGAFGAGATCGTNTGAGSLIARLTTFRSSLSDNNGTAFWATGSNAVHRLGRNEIVGNVHAFGAVSGGVITSFGDNYVIGNTIDESPSGSFLPRSRVNIKAGSSRRVVRRSNVKVRKVGTR